MIVVGALQFAVSQTFALAKPALSTVSVELARPERVASWVSA